MIYRKRHMISDRKRHMISEWIYRKNIFSEWIYRKTEDLEVIDPITLNRSFNEHN